ncbi:M43 family zinc metalloprotease [Reichenbachiella versicolor]|uniref:M43 family zinc metalloprotease n=1 Tax=Reichenbachiella versicolor TaxID=1821036 RepID=UPI0013A564E4|nr:M43 family zinc metalloprotease [Reichenbachiella versicolor]
MKLSLKHIAHLIYVLLIVLSSELLAKNIDYQVINTVVHIVYNNEFQNISDSQVRSQIQVLNNDYSANNSDLKEVDMEFQGIIGNPRIQFQLASEDPFGEITTGIERHETTHGVFANSDIYSSKLGGADAWDTERYLNIWVTDLAPGIVGFATTPITATSVEDGVVVDFTAFGLSGTVVKPYNLGRTTTHEVGHYLGLHHLWGTGGCNTDDGIFDTPNQEKKAGCGSESSSCGSTDMIQNYMNVADDECLLFFTEGQSQKMATVLENYRNNIWSFSDSPVTSVNDSPSFETKIYPNPTKDGTLIISSPNDTFINLFQINGQRILTLVNTKTPVSIKLPKEGVYLIKYGINNTHEIKRIVYAKN